MQWYDDCLTHRMMESVETIPQGHVGVSPEAQWRLFFWIGVPAVALAASLATPQSNAAGTILFATGIAAAALSGMALYRTLWPLFTQEPPEAPRTAGGRTLAALEREKTLVLRSIKELEFDQRMGKVSGADFAEMSKRLRMRAIGIIRQLEEGDAPDGYRRLIEKELETRLADDTVEIPTSLRAQAASSESPVRIPSEPATTQVAAVDPILEKKEHRTCLACTTPNDRDARFCKQCGTAFDPLCGHCDTSNDADARFCKRCGVPLEATSEE